MDVRTLAFQLVTKIKCNKWILIITHVLYSSKNKGRAWTIGVLVQKWKKDYEPPIAKSDDKAMFQVKCADCGCLPEECENSPSAKECSNCSWDECCCWVTIAKG